MRMRMTSRIRKKARLWRDTNCSKKNLNCFGQAKTDKNDNENNSSFSVGYIGSSFATEIRVKI